MSTDLESLADFERDHYDRYEYYNLQEYGCGAGGKGRTKREIELNGNRHVPAGHERKIEEKLHNSEIKRRSRSSSH
ncbi:nuclear protein 2 [Pelobates fuscus]|uniref:nuclear protein 2 n=1 Tax=Pelobates fuscus TaxID=191477 RepID=UPI002FE4B055